MRSERGCGGSIYSRKVVDERERGHGVHESLVKLCQRCQAERPQRGVLLIADVR